MFLLLFLDISSINDGYMLKKERQTFILHQVNLHNKVLSSTLSSEMNVSEDTIRRDLQELSDEGKLIKVHGGALSLSFQNILPAGEEIYSLKSKRIIAQKTSSLIKDGMFVLTSGGTTIIELAKILPHGLKATFISGSIPAVFEYMKHPGLDVIMIGDKVSKSSRITVGSDAIQQIRKFKADLCILGINAIDPKVGITDNDLEVVQVKKAMMESARTVVCVSIKEKLNTIQPIQICEPSCIDILITEDDPTDNIFKPYIEAGIRVM